MNKADKNDIALVVSGLLVIAHTYREQHITQEAIDDYIDTAKLYADRLELKLNNTEELTNASA